MTSVTWATPAYATLHPAAHVVVPYAVYEEPPPVPPPPAWARNARNGAFCEIGLLPVLPQPNENTTKNAAKRNPVRVAIEMDFINYLLKNEFYFESDVLVKRLIKISI